MNKLILLFLSVTSILIAQFPTTTTDKAVQTPKESPADKSAQEKPQETPIKLTGVDVEYIESIIDEKKNIVLKITRPKNNNFWRFVDGIKYDKENYLAAELWRLEKEEDENYPLLRLYVRVFESQFLEHLYKKEKYKDWKEFWKKMFFVYEVSSDPNSLFEPEKIKIEKNLVDASYKIGGKKVGVIEYQIVGTPRAVENISYRVRAIIFKDKQYTIIFRTLAQVVGRETSETMEKELLEILNKTTFVEVKKK